MNQQCRLFIESDEPTANRIALALEAHFDEEGIPVALFEVEADAPVWSVSLYVPMDECDSFKSRIAEILAHMQLKPDIGMETLGQTNWVARTLSELSPVTAGRFIVHGSHDNHLPKAHQHKILIDAGMAFGTGHHGTTAGCLEMLDQVLKKRKYHNALDLGTGSGVLAIAIAKAAHIHVLASDIDPIATNVATANCRLNGVGAAVTCVTAAGFNHRRIKAGRPYDLVVANILARPLEKLAHEMAMHAALGATIILSGLLPHQKSRILAAYRQQGFAFESALIRDGWLVLVLKS